MLRFYDKEFIAELHNDAFYKIFDKISVLMYLPYDPMIAVYNGPELKIKIKNTSADSIWSNMNLTNEFDNSFRTHDVAVSKENQDKYDKNVAYLIEICDKIFSERLNKH